MILKGFQRSTMEYSDRWEVEFASSGREALIRLKDRSFDAVVSDMYMPGMDGIQFLEEASQLAPGVIRFILSGNINETQILKSTHLVHQALTKPCDMEKVYDIVERACSLRGMLSNPNLLQLITGIKNLPSVPKIYQQLLDHIESDTISTMTLGNIIAQDAAMTAKILQIVNSAFFGVSDKICSPQKAVTFLGIRTVKSLVLGIQVFSGHKNPEKSTISVDAVWEHSLKVSNLAYTIAQQLNLNQWELEDTRVSGILHDIGLLLSFQIPDYEKKMSFNKNGQPLIESEYQFLGTSHAEMGGYLLGIWGIPNPIVEAVTFHHFPGGLSTAQPGIVTALHVANGLLNMCQDQMEESPSAYLDLAYLQKMGLVHHLDDWITIARKGLNTPI